MINSWCGRPGEPGTEAELEDHLRTMMIDTAPMPLMMSDGRETGAGDAEIDGRATVVRPRLRWRFGSCSSPQSGRPWTHAVGHQETLSQVLSHRSFGVATDPKPPFTLLGSTPESRY